VNLHDKEVVLEIKAGNKLVFERVYASFFYKLSYFSRQYLSDTDEADNIAQEVFTSLWEKHMELAEDTNLQAWLFTVAKNKSLKRIRKLQSQQNYLEDFKAREMDVNYQALIELDTSERLFEELESRIQAALAKLSPAVRQVFEKSRFEEKKNREIADELGLSIKTVEAHISKSLKLLRQELKDFLPLILFL
jgi:RNA polymerase sigma-70 factor (ECF subfamily)